jgi:hypothetical protein
VKLKIPKPIKVLAFVFFISSWLLMCGNSVDLFITRNQQGMDELAFGPLDIVRRITSPDGKKTAILVRSYASFQASTNFILYITDDPMTDVTNSTVHANFITEDDLAKSKDSVVWIRRALWVSQDFNPTTDKNWHEDIAWSRDGEIIVVVVEGQYVFAYDLGTKQRYEKAEEIVELFNLHSN